MQRQERRGAACGEQQLYIWWWRHSPKTRGAEEMNHAEIWRKSSRQQEQQVQSP